jgi:RNA polymerase sigma-70 factor, ECF subfamily
MTTMVSMAVSRSTASPGPADTAPIRDIDLIRDIQARDESALRAALVQHGSRVWRVAVRTLRDAARAEEVVQDTFLALWLDPARFDPHRGSLGAFLVGIAHHKSVDVIRQRGARERATARLVEIDQTGGVNESWGPSATLDLLFALNKLSPKLKETMFWAFYVGLTYREVADQMNIPEGTAKSRIRDALRQLRNELSDRSDGDGSEVERVSH